MEQAKKSDYKKAAGLFKVFSHPTRLMIINELMIGRKCVNDIKELVHVNQPNISQHLALLKMHGIVDSLQNGKMKCYFLKQEEMIRKILKILRNNSMI